MNTTALFYRALRVRSCCCHVQLKRCKILLLLEGRDLMRPFPSDVVLLDVTDLWCFLDPLKCCLNSLNGANYLEVDFIVSINVVL